MSGNLQNLKNIVSSIESVLSMIDTLEFDSSDTREVNEILEKLLSNKTIDNILNQVNKKIVRKLDNFASVSKVPPKKVWRSKGAIPARVTYDGKDGGFVQMHDSDSLEENRLNKG